MKKTKILMPILSAGAIAATMAPIATMSACSKIAFTIVKVENNNPTFRFDLKWRNYNPEDEKHHYKIDINSEHIKCDYAVDIQTIKFDNNGEFNEEKIVSCDFNLYRSVAEGDTVKVWIQFNIIDTLHESKIHVKNQKIYITCKPNEE